jgi:hypothetical protein
MHCETSLTQHYQHVKCHLCHGAQILCCEYCILVQQVTCAQMVIK